MATSLDHNKVLALINIIHQGTALPQFIALRDWATKELDEMQKMALTELDEAAKLKQKEEAARQQEIAAQKEQDARRAAVANRVNPSQVKPLPTESVRRPLGDS